MNGGKIKLSRKPALIWSIVGSTLAVAAVVAVLFYLDVHEEVLRLLEWFDHQEGWLPALFILVMALVVVLLLPGLPFTTGAGFVFGVVEGSVYVVLGTTLGASIAFLVARYLFGRRARDYVRAHGKLRFASEEFAPVAWRIVMLTRLVPFFPFKLSNYLFGLTPCPLRGFAGGTFLGIIPFSVHNVYLGSIAANMATLGERHVGRGALEWTLYGTGFLAIIALILYLNRIARRALARYNVDERSEASSR